MNSNLNDWGKVKQQIQKSKIKRFPYKKLLGQSLTNFILLNRKMGLNKADIKQKILCNNSVVDYLILNPYEVEKFHENINISLCARFAEERSRSFLR